MSRPGDPFDKRNGGLVEWIHDELPDKRKFFAQNGYMPHKGQEQLHAALDLAPMVVACCGARFGKSKAAANEMLYEGMLPRKQFTGWTVAPTADLADVIFTDVMDVVRECFHTTPGAVSIRETEGEIIFPNTGGGVSKIFRKTTYDAEGKGKLAGRGVDFMVGDEGAKIRPDAIWRNELRPRLVDRGGRFLAISTPMGPRGWFAELFRRGLVPGSGVISLRLPSWMNPHIPREKWIEERREATQHAWDQEYAAKFVSLEGNVFSDLLVDACANGELEPPLPGMQYFAGIDLALKEDYTVCLIFKAGIIPQIVHVLRMRRVPRPEQVRKIGEVLRRYQAAAYYDGTGLGDAFRDDFSDAGLECYPKLWTAKTKRDMIQNALLLVEREKVRLPRRDSSPACAALIDELTSYEWKLSGEYEVGTAPDGMHDDCVSAFLMGSLWFRGAGAQGASAPGAKLPTKKVVQATPNEVRRYADRLAGPKRLGSGLRGGARGGRRPFGLG